MGVGAVASLLVADEVEHHRCGIGCVLESNHSTGGVYLGRFVRGGTAETSSLEEGDEIVQVDRSAVVRGRDTVDSVSGYIRGKEGSVVTICVRKPWGEVVSVRLVRQRLPGSKTELLGALWQKHGTKAAKDITLEDKLDVLEQLYRRRNLTEHEYHVARRRLTEESAAVYHQSDVNAMDQAERSVASLIQSVGEEWAKLTRDPALEQAKMRQNRRSQGSVSSDEAMATPRSGQRSAPATPVSSRWSSPQQPDGRQGVSSQTSSRISPNQTPVLFQLLETTSSPTFRSNASA